MLDISALSHPAIESPTVSIVVVNLNGRALLPDCLDSLTAQDYPRERSEIIVVDNGSSDDSVAFMRAAYPDVTVIAAEHNLGLAGGNNLGARRAAGDYVAFINNDACADPHWLCALCKQLEAHPDVACIASKLLDADGTPLVNGDVMDGIDEVSKSPQVVQWKIKPGVTWSDGQPWNCKDFYLAYLAGSGKIPGFTTASSNGYGNIGQAQCLNDQTFQATFATPYAIFTITPRPMQSSRGTSPELAPTSSRQQKPDGSSAQRPIT